MTPAATKPLLTPAEVCAGLRISRATFYRLVHAGELPALTVGGQIRVSPAELREWLYGKPEGRD